MPDGAEMVAPPVDLAYQSTVSPSPTIAEAVFTVPSYVYSLFPVVGADGKLSEVTGTTFDSSDTVPSLVQTPQPVKEKYTEPKVNVVLLLQNAAKSSVIDMTPAILVVWLLYSKATVTVRQSRNCLIDP